MTKEMLIRLAELYGGHRGLTLATVSTYAAADGKYFRNLKGNSGLTLQKANRLLAWFSVHWPADLEWPADIPRPARREEAA
ncbi:MAG: hypothetical protein KF887_06920 [Paracoccaceae bacterium]|nr:MAG: hypothetical protein KF887_06920 [Paracoccaceae bacterium]